MNEAFLLTFFGQNLVYGRTEYYGIINVTFRKREAKALIIWTDCALGPTAN